jgi:chloramphenicol 3-O phosphotransferase
MLLDAKPVESGAGAEASVGVILNGASSAGKTTIARALQRRLGVQWVVLSLDDFSSLLHPDRPWDWTTFHSLTQIVFGTAATCARLGLSFVVDTVFERVDCYEAYRSALAHIATLFVHVDCALPVLLERERKRSDRRQGLAAEQASRIHADYAYDLSVDSAAFSPDQCAEQIIQALEARRASAAADARLMRGRRAADARVKSDRGARPLQQRSQEHHDRTSNFTYRGNGRWRFLDGAAEPTARRLHPLSQPTPARAGVLPADGQR